MAVKVFTGIKELLTLSDAAKKQGRRIVEDDLSIIRDGAIIENKGRILWVGEKKKLRRLNIGSNIDIKKAKHIDLAADCVLPALIESHTHLVFAGDRKNEFELRNQGVSYQEIAKQGGGIRATVRATQKMSAAKLLEVAEQRAKNFLRQGVTTIEAKSGYGLSESDEIKLLSVGRKIKSARIINTYLGPHAIPEGRNAQDYLNEIIQSTLPKIKKSKLADRVDMFIEENYYSISQARSYYQAATELGFRLSGHADQLTRTGASRFLAELDADSIDHVIQVSDGDVMALANSSSTCVLLPASDFYLKMKYPPARMLIDKGVRVALATDFNPGTSPTQSVSFVGVLARLQMSMTLPEVINAYTLAAAYALNLQTSLGSLEVGKLADFAVLEGSWRELFYEVGHHPVRAVYSEGQKS